jgi:hypothetical protein
MENEKIEYKPIKWYKSEFAWLLISLGWQLIIFLLIGLYFLPESFFWVGLVGTAYTAYFTIKGIIYAWIINPYNAWKRKRNK